MRITEISNFEKVESMKIRYVFENGCHSIYKLREVEMGLLRINLDMLKDGSSAIVRRDLGTGLRDINSDEIFLNDVVEYGDAQIGKVHLRDGSYMVNGEPLSSLENLIKRRNDLI